MPVHLFGRPAPLAELAAFGVPIVEDAAQAFGSPEIAGQGSPRPSASIRPRTSSALGDGGLVAATDDELADRIRMLRFHGSKAKKTFEYIGYNSRLDEVQAACASDLPARTRRLDGSRREAAARYVELGLGELSRSPWTSRATSTTSSSAARPSATASAPR